MERYTLEQLISDPVFCHFYRISQIPHGSGNEQALAESIVRWARSIGLHAGCDAAGNVFLRKPNPGAVALYEKLGFRATGEIEESEYMGETWHCQEMMLSL